MDKYIQKASVLIEALPYIQRFRDEVVVVKFGGSAMEAPECVESTLRDIVFMECVGMKPVIVHGGGKAISARLREQGIATHFINGMRYTCKDTIAVVDEVLHDNVNRDLVGQFNELGGAASALSGKDILQATPLDGRDVDGQPVDLGYVGEVAAVDIQPIQDMLARNEVPVITPLGIDANGNTYNINADLSACRIAQELQARKLVFLSDVPGILADPADESTLISTVRLDEVDALTQNGVISGGMVPKVTSAVAALRAGTNKVHFIDARLQHSLLLEVFTDSGVGTQIVKS